MGPLGDHTLPAQGLTSHTLLLQVTIDLERKAFIASIAEGRYTVWDRHGAQRTSHTPNEYGIREVIEQAVAAFWY